MDARNNILQYFGRRNRGWILALILAVCVVYLPFLGTSFFFDDLPFFQGGMAERFARADLNFTLRWLPYTLQGFIYRFAGDALTHLYHLLNLFIHIANTILLFILLQKLLAVVTPSQHNEHVQTRGAWFAALIFALHPVASYAVGYVLQLSILLATLFALLMQLFYLHALVTGRKRNLILAVLAYILACFSKEHSVLMPAVLLALTVLMRRKIAVSRTALWLAWLLFAAVGLTVVFVQKGLFGTPYEAMAIGLFEQQNVAQGSAATLHLLSILTQAGLYFKYLWLWLLPNPAWMAIDMREPFVSSLGLWRGWAAAVGFMAYGWVAVRLLIRGQTKGLVGFALLYPWLQFWLEFSSIRVQEVFVLYRSYLWMPGSLILIALLVIRWPGKKVTFALGVAALLLLPLTINRLWVFADNYRLWNDAAQLLPNKYVAGSDRIFFNRAQASAAAHEWESAIVDFQQVVAISPEMEPVRVELGMALVNVGRYQDAMEQFERAIQLSPNNGQGYYGKGLVLMGMHQSWEASRQMEIACKLGTSLACMMQQWRKK